MKFTVKRMINVYQNITIKYKYADVSRFHHEMATWVSVIVCFSCHPLEMKRWDKYISANPSLKLVLRNSSRWFLNDDPSVTAFIISCICTQSNPNSGLLHSECMERHLLQSHHKEDKIKQKNQRFQKKKHMFVFCIYYKYCIMYYRTIINETV